MSLRTRDVLVSVIILAAGFAGLGLFFTDTGPGGTPAGRIALVCGILFTAGAVIGAITGPAWPLSAVTAWGSGMMGLIVLAATLSKAGGAEVRAERASLAAALGTLVLPIVAALAGGYLGRCLRELSKASRMRERPRRA